MNELVKILNLLYSQKNNYSQQNDHNQNQNNKNNYYPSDIANESNKNCNNNNLDIPSLLKMLSSNNTSDIFKNLPNGVGNILSLLNNNKKTASTTVSKKSISNFKNYISVEDYYS